jgi:hypothetical protein
VWRPRDRSRDPPASSRLSGQIERSVDAASLGSPHPRPDLVRHREDAQLCSRLAASRGSLGPSHLCHGSCRRHLCSLQAGLSEGVASGQAPSAAPSGRREEGDRMPSPLPLPTRGAVMWAPPRARSVLPRTNTSSSRHATGGEMPAAPLICGRLHRPGAHACSGRASGVCFDERPASGSSGQSERGLRW